MTQGEINQIKDLIDGCVTGLNARVESQYNVIDIKLDGINKHLEKLNGSVKESAEEIVHIQKERATNLQFQQDWYESHKNVLDDIMELKTKDRIAISKRQLFFSIVLTLSLITAIAVSALKINESLRTKAITEEVQTIIKSINVTKQ